MMMSRQRCEFDAGELLPDGKTRWTCIRPECGRVIEYAAAKPPYSSCPKIRNASVVATPRHGPGTELLAICKELRVRKPPGCRCAAFAGQMNRWGVSGCREHRAAIVAHLIAAWGAARWGLKDWTGTAAEAVRRKQALHLSITDPIGSLVDEAIRRAAALD